MTDQIADEGCIHEECWFPACAAPTEVGGTLDCCTAQACRNPQCPAAFSTIPQGAIGTSEGDTDG